MKVGIVVSVTVSSVMLDTVTEGCKPIREGGGGGVPGTYHESTDNSVTCKLRWRFRHILLHYRLQASSGELSETEK